MMSTVIIKSCWEENRQIVRREGALSYLSSGFSFSEAAGWLSAEAPLEDQETPAIGSLQIQKTHQSHYRSYGVIY